MKRLKESSVAKLQDYMIKAKRQPIRAAGRNLARKKIQAAYNFPDSKDKVKVPAKLSEGLVKKLIKAATNKMAKSQKRNDRWKYHIPSQPKPAGAYHGEEIEVTEGDVIKLDLSKKKPTAKLGIKGKVVPFAKKETSVDRVKRFRGALPEEAINEISSKNPLLNKSYRHHSRQFDKVFDKEVKLRMDNKKVPRAMKGKANYHASQTDRAAGIINQLDARENAKKEKRSAFNVFGKRLASINQYWKDEEGESKTFARQSRRKAKANAKYAQPAATGKAVSPKVTKRKDGKYETKINLRVEGYSKKFIGPRISKDEKEGRKLMAKDREAGREAHKKRLKDRPWLAKGKWNHLTSEEALDEVKYTKDVADRVKSIRGFKNRFGHTPPSDIGTDAIDRWTKGPFRRAVGEPLEWSHHDGAPTVAHPHYKELTKKRLKTEQTEGNYKGPGLFSRIKDAMQDRKTRKASAKLSMGRSFGSQADAELVSHHEPEVKAPAVVRPREDKFSGYDTSRQRSKTWKGWKPPKRG
jgi:hypothetical protein